MRYRSIAAILLIVGSAAATAPARAVTTEEIRLGLQDWVGNLLLRTTLGVSATLDGTIEVAVEGAGFRATVPPMRLAFRSGTEIAVEAIAIDLQPLTSGDYAANWDLPETVRMRDRDGGTVALTLGRRSGHGIYAPDLGLMLTSELELRDIRAAAAGKPAHLAIDSFVFSARYEPAGSGLFDHTTSLEIGGLTGFGEDGAETVRIDGFSLSNGASGVDLAAWRELQAAIRSASVRGDGQAPSLAARLAGRTVGGPTLLASFEGRHRIDGLRLAIDGSTLSIGDGDLALSMDGLDSGTASIAVGFNLSGFDLPAALGPLAPRGVTVDLVVTGLPTVRLIDAMTAMVTGPAMPGGGHALMMFGMHLQDAMMTSGARIEVRNIHLTTEQASLRIAGTIKPTYAAPLGVIAELDMTITGLDSLIAAARNRQGAEDMLRPLAMLQAVGARGAAADGTPARRYALRITDTGQVLMNGTNLMPAVASAAP